MTDIINLCAILQAWQKNGGGLASKEAIGLLKAIQEKCDHVENQKRVAERQIAQHKSTEVLIKRLLGCE